FTVDQYNQILHLLGKSSITSLSQDDKPSNAISTGMISPSVVTEAEVRWIVDMGASNHMVKSLKVLEESRTVDESSIGKVHLRTGRIDSKAYRIYKCATRTKDYKCNLLSVSKFTKELRCLALLYPDFCLFRDLFNGRVGGIGKE
ncbi:hypothetical protein A4A49_61668, partial [Nicotiana attenuata]